MPPAWKFLSSGRYSTLTGFTWPEGDWVEAAGELVPALNGIHGCRVGDLPYWVDEELWRVELDGELLASERTLVARRGRLVEPVAGWDEETRRNFTAACAERDCGIGTEAAYDGGWVPYAGQAYIAAHGAGLEAEAAGGSYEDAFAAERAWQAAWLADRLELDS